MLYADGIKVRDCSFKSLTYSVLEDGLARVSN